MLGTSPLFARYETPPFVFPDELHFTGCQIHNERHFIEFLLRNDWVQRIVGIKMFSSNGLFPDIIGEIYDGSGDMIRVEAEYKAENYLMHNHPYRGCDLILSFLRKGRTRFIKGIPVWSFYIDYEHENTADLTLYDDIQTDFNNLGDYENNLIKRKRKVIDLCSKCGDEILIRGSHLCNHCRSASFSLSVHG